MNLYEIQITEKAIADMRDIGDYISIDLKEPNLASKLINKFEKAIYELETMPLKYSFVSDKYLSGLRIRKLPVENYIIFYTVSEQGKIVFIIRVLYKKRNWINLL